MTDTRIEWADAVWNPVTGCTRVSQGCANCYAETMARRMRGMAASGAPGARIWADREFTDVRIHPERLEQPLHWRKPRRVFVNSMSDLFHEDVPQWFLYDVLDIVRRCPQHTFLVLTKRARRMSEVDWHCAKNAQNYAAMPNLWLGVSVENQATADERIPLLLQTPAAVRFVSAEPLLGPLNLTHCGEIDGHPLCCLDCHPLVQDQEKCIGIDWVIVGGESGPGARPCNVEWIRSIVRQCKEAAVPCFVKQLGAMSVTADAETSSEFNHCGVRLRLHPVLHPWFARMMFKHPKGADPAEWPEDLQVRQWLEVQP